MEPQPRLFSSARDLSRREVLRLSGLLALGLWPGALRAQGGGNPGDFSFIVVNDLHFQSARCGPWFERVVRQMKATEPAPEFCLILGDYSEHGTAAELNAARQAFAELGIPSFGVIGNHDYETPVDRSAYEKAFPDRLNYHFENVGWNFLGLDSSEGQKSGDTTIQPATLRWLEETLPKLDKKRPTVLFTHFPLGFFVPSRPLNADAVLQHFIGFNLQAVFSGHFHAFTTMKVGQVTLTTNRCCAISRANHDGTKEKGYFVCQAKNGTITKSFVEVKTPAA